MAALGLFALGLFVGTIVATGVDHTANWKNSAKVVASFLSAALAGTVLTFIQRVGGPSLNQSTAYCYPLGLAYALIWYYTPVAIDHIKSTNSGLRFLGWLHIMGLVVSVVLGALLFFSPTVRQLLPN